MFLYVCRSIDDFVRAFPDMSPARVPNGIKRSFGQMTVSVSLHA